MFKDRWFNYRPIALVFGFLLLGSVFSFYITKTIVITMVVMSLALGVIIALAIYKKNLKYLMIPAIAFVIGILFYSFYIYRFNRGINYLPKTIQARIYNISSKSNAMLRVEADSCKFNSKEVKSNIIIYIYDDLGLYENIEIGSVIEFKPYKFYKSDIFYNKIPNAQILSNDLKYSTSVLMTDIRYIKTDKTFAEQIKDKIKENLSIGLTNENADIAFSALFGDKDFLSEKQYDIYKMSGIAHLLAVSGLHVGIIVGLLQLFLNFRKKRKWWKLFVIFTVLLFYCYLCGFSVSVVRASIMSIILLVATVLGREYDPINAISIAGIIIFILNPLSVFDISFLLSFACVIAITMLYSPIEIALNKIKTPKSISKSLAVSISATVGIMFIMAYYFKTLNIISIIANIALIPIFSFAFSIVFVVSMASLLVPALMILLYPMNYIFNIVSIVASMLSRLPISSLHTITFNFMVIIIYFGFLLLAGRFCTAKYQYKLIITIPMLALLVCCLL